MGSAGHSVVCLAALLEAACEAFCEKVNNRTPRADLVVVDDIGLLPLAADAAEGLHRLIDAPL